MKNQSIRHIAILLGALALFGAVLSASASAAEREKSEKARYIVFFKDSVKAPASLARTQTENRNAKLGFVYRLSFKGYSAEMTKAQVQGLREDARVDFIAPDREVEAFAQSTPTGIDRVFATANKALAINEEDDIRIDADIAVIDTGTDHQHPDLDVVARTDCSKGTEQEASCEDESGTDNNGHGTHVAGTAAAIDNDYGVVGVAPGARIWAVKVLGSGINYDSEIAAGIEWVTARAEDIDVANMSLGCLCELPATAKAIDGSVEAGVVHVVAAGNSGINAQFAAPANHPDVITVSALADFDGEPLGQSGTTACRENYESSWGAHYDDSLAAFSNWGSHVEVVAPGVCILSTTPGGNYAETGWWGTSMASPHVAGAAAILAAEDKPESKSDVEAIRDTIVEEGNFDWVDMSGDGVIEPLLDVSDETVFALQVPPTVTAEAATGLGTSESTLNATVNPKALATTYQFEYGKTTSYGLKAPTSPQSIGSGSTGVKVSKSIIGLDPDTAYHFRVVATNSAGTTKSDDMTFKTSAGAPPIPTTGEVTEMSNGEKATLNGQVDPSGLATSYYFEYGPGSAEGGAKVPATPKGIGSGTSPVTVDEKVIKLDLEPNAAHYYRLVATNSQGTSYGAERLFPSAVTKHATDVNEVAATLNGLIRLEEDEEMEFWFEYGETSEYGETVGNKPLTGAPHDYHAIDAVVKGLDVHTTYHYRLVAMDVSTEEVTVGEDMTLTTGRVVTFMVNEEPLEEGMEIRGVANGFASNFLYGPYVCPPVEITAEVLDNQSAEATLKPTSDLQLEGCKYEHTWNVDFDLTLSPIRFMGGESNGEELFEAEDQFPAEVEVQSGVIAPWFGVCQIVGESYSAVAWHSSSVVDVYKNFETPVCSVSSFDLGGYLEFTLPDETPIETVVGVPTVTTHDAIEVGKERAIMKASVNPNGEWSTYQFEYGKSTSYGSTVPASPADVGSGNSAVVVSKLIQGLEADTTYHFRVSATNGHGTSKGIDRTFTTPAQEYGFWVAGEGSEVEAEQPRFEAGSYENVHWIIGWGGESVLHLDDFECVDLNVVAQPSEPTATLLLSDSTYFDGGCSRVGSGWVPEQRNSCTYSLGVHNAGPPYTGTFGISCNEEGDRIEFKASSKGEPTCQINLGPQAVGGIEFSNVGGALEREVELVADVEGIEYEIEGTCVEEPEIRTDGTWVGEIQMVGAEE